MARGAMLVAGGLVVAAVAAGCGAVSRVSQTVVCNGLAPGSAVTVAHPLPCFAKRTTLARAAASSGVQLVLPNTGLVRASDAGPVWIDGFSHRDGHKTVGTVAITFPAQRVIVSYTRPTPFSGDAQTHYQGVALGIRHSRVIDLKQRPALVIRQDSDATGHNFGVVMLKLHRTEVRVMGHRDQASLERMALSILNESSESRSS